MAHIGNAPASFFTAVSSDVFSANGTATSFSLSKSISNLADVELIVNNIQQNPFGGSYSVSGSTLTFSEAPAAGSNNVVVTYRQATIGSTIPTPNTVGNNSLQSNLSLTGTTTTQHIVPSANIAYDLGTSTMRYRDLYLSGGTITLGDVTLTTNGSTFSVANTTGGLLPSTFGNTTITGTANVTSAVNIGANVGITATGIAIGNSTVNTSITSSTIDLGTQFDANTTGLYHTGTVNAASFSVGSSFMANSTALTTTSNTVSLGTAAYFVANGNVGIGAASPLSKLDVRGTVLSIPAGTDQFGFQMFKTGTSITIAGFYQDTTNNGALALYNTSAAASVSLSGATANALILDASGNMGMRVAPSAWAGPALQIGGVGIASRGSGSPSLGQFSVNQYWDGASHRYIASSFATIYTQNEGVHNWGTAPSGTAGANISFTTAMTLNSNGNVVIGSTVADPLSLARDRNLAIVTTGTSGALTIVGGQNARIDFGVGATRTAGVYSDTTNFTEIFTSTALPLVFSTNSTQRARISSSGDFTLNGVAGFNVLGFEPATAIASGGVNFISAINTTNLAFRTASTERARFNTTGAFVFAGGTTTADGIGITFPATQSASSNANTLDDYEEGNWTPNLTGSGGGTYTMGGINSGRYVKIGKLIFVSATLQWSAVSAGYSGNLIVNGLPYQSNGTQRAAGIVGAVSSGLAFTAGYGEWHIVVDPNQFFFYIIQSATSGSGYSHNPTVSSSGIVYSISLVYETGA